MSSKGPSDLPDTQRRNCSRRCGAGGGGKERRRLLARSRTHNTIVAEIGVEAMLVMPGEKSSTVNIAEYGLRLRMLEEYCIVEQVMAYSAADQCGLELGDILEQIDGEPTGHDLFRVVRAIKGNDGSTCTLRVLKHDGVLEDLKLWRMPSSSKTLLLEQIGLWVQRKPCGEIVVARGKSANVQQIPYQPPDLAWFCKIQRTPRTRAVSYETACFIS
jgi:hypothetical protein